MRIIKGFYQGKLIVGIVDDKSDWSGNATPFIDMNGGVCQLKRSELSDMIDMEEVSDKCNPMVGIKQFTEPRVEVALKQLGAKEINIIF